MSRLDAIAAEYDLVVVGGGITGTGVLREASRGGARVLLVERNDFASGTSSWSSKLVHGGLRYLKTGQWRLTLESVRERQRLLSEAPGLVERLGFVLPLYTGQRPGPFTMRTGLRLYDAMAGVRRSGWLDAAAALRRAPRLREAGLLGAVYYEDAGTDDARLVLRVLQEAVQDGATALNYATVTGLLRDNGSVTGVRLQDGMGRAARDIRARVVVNATGAWAEQLAGSSPQAPRLRPLRGSHLVFPFWRFPLAQAVSWLHPRDRRPVFAEPWEGAVVYGTTDLDHAGDPGTPRMSADEAEYLVEGLQHQFPCLGLQARDALASYAGVRPVVAGGAANPSDESRESAMWSSPGLVGITGGKLTTFRVTARQVLAEAAKQHAVLAPAEDAPVFRAVAGQRRYAGRYGVRAVELATYPLAEHAPLGATPYCLAELRLAARHEQVHHLDDLLLRRVRLGLVAPGGGAPLLPRIESVCGDELGWSHARWREECERYLALWQERHAVTP